MYKKILIIATILAAISVILGAMAAHILEQHLTNKMLNAFKTATQYQMYHSLAIALCGLLYKTEENKYFKKAFYLFFVGIFLFSGSLYVLSLLSLTQITSLNFIGAITPIGGLCFIAGWICLAVAISKIK